MLTHAFCELLDLLEGRRILVLSGAGCSTESGIPDYRGPDAEPKVRKPILYQQFVRDPEARVKYWARSSIGWERVANAMPNRGHLAVARMESAGAVGGTITQNVDGLHQAAGSKRVIELHGNLDDVRCLDCGESERRADLQQRLLDLNPTWTRAGGPASEGGAQLAPDGDTELAPELARSFRVASCLRCGGVLKPDVVFFGENVPPSTLHCAWEVFEDADVLLVAGSSLAVYSSYRFVERAKREGKPVAIVNIGTTRGDDLAQVKVQGRTGEVLPALADALL